MCEPEPDTCRPGDGAPQVSHSGWGVLRGCLSAGRGGGEIRLGTLVSRLLDGSFLLVGYLKPRAPSLYQ